MNYEAEVLENSKIFEYEGSIVIKIGDISLMVAYQAPFDFAKDYIRIHQKILIDLWLIYGKIKKINVTEKVLPTNLKVAGGTIKGEVKKIFSSHILRADCGLLEIDIDNEESLKEICENDFIETEGAYQIYFPKTDWARN